MWSKRLLRRRHGGARDPGGDRDHLRDHRPGRHLHQSPPRDPLHEQRRSPPVVLDRLHRAAGRRRAAAQQRVIRAAVGFPSSRTGPAYAPVDAPAHPALPRQATGALARMSGEHLFNATGNGQDLRGGSFHEPGSLRGRGRTGRRSRPAGQRAGHSRHPARSSCRSRARRQSAAGRLVGTPDVSSAPRPRTSAST